MSQMPQLLESALNYHQAGYLPQAEQLYRQILQSQPDDLDANHLLGLLLLQANFHEPALQYLRHAATLGPQFAAFQSSLGDALRAIGRVNEAVDAYRRAMQLEPQVSDHVGKMAIMLQAEKRFDEALELYHRAVTINPQDRIACNNAGSIHLERREFEQARDWFRRALQIHPEFVEAWSNLGTTLRELKQWPEAEHAFKSALQLQPNFAEAHKQLGVFYGQQGQPAEAAQSLEQAVRLVPGDHESRNLLGVAYNTLDRLSEAAEQLEEAIRLKPDFVDAYANLGLSYGALGQTQSSRAAFDRALALGAGDAVRIRAALLLPVVPDSVEGIAQARRQFQEHIAALLQKPLSVRNPVEEVCRISFYPAYHGLNDRDLQQQVARLFLHATPSLAYTAPHCAAGVVRLPRNGRKIRVALVSRYFYNHSVGIHYLGLIQNLPREAIELTVVRLGANEDNLAAAIRKSADKVIELTGPIDSWRERLAAEQFDIVCYTDLGMDPSTYFLAFARLAPVQCVLPGHPVTTGIPAIDYFISSVDLEPDAAHQHYTERLVKLNNLPSSFTALRPSSLTTTRRDFNLAEDAHLYVCPQMPFKIHPEFDTLAREILRRDPRGVLALFHDQQRKWSPLLAERLKHTMADVSDRVVFLGRLTADGFYRFLSLADVLLDSVHFSGGTTAAQALSLGIPVVTLPGEFMRGRVTYALYHRMGVTDCIARDRDHYVELALQLAADPVRRAEIAGRLQAAVSSVFEPKAFSEELAGFFRSVAPGG